MNDYRNDALHPTLSRARALSQVTLGPPGGLPMAVQAGGWEVRGDAPGSAGRARYGVCQVLESTGAGGLTDFTFGGTQKGVSWSLNPYSGCQHACTYCYVPDTIKAQRGRWGRYAVVKKDLPTRLARMVAGQRRRTVYLSTATDPYHPLEAEHQITRRCLEVLARKDWPVEVLTRSPLVLRDLDLLQQLSQVRVGFSIPTLEDDVRRAIEPHAPSIPSRLRALGTLANTGIATFANHTPACPPMEWILARPHGHMRNAGAHAAGTGRRMRTGPADASGGAGRGAADEDAGGRPSNDAARGVARAFLDAGAQWVNSKGLQRQDTTLVPMWERLHGTRWEPLTRFLADRPLQEAWHQELGVAFRGLGLPLSTPFFNPPFEALAPMRRTGQKRLDEVPLLVVCGRPTGGRR